jgi:hypothetical protein
MLLLATTTVAPSTTRDVVVVSGEVLVVGLATVVATPDDAAPSVADGPVDAVSSPPLQAATRNPLAKASETIRMRMLTSIANLRPLARQTVIVDRITSPVPTASVGAVLDLEGGYVGAATQ